MASIRTLFGVTMAALLIVASLATYAHGQALGSDHPLLGGKWRTVTHLTGEVVCARCSLYEVQAGRLGTWPMLHQLTHRLGRVVMQIHTVNDSHIWNVGDLYPEIAILSKDELFQQLAAEETLFKEVEIIGLLSNTQMLEIFQINVLSKNILTEDGWRTLSRRD